MRSHLLIWVLLQANAVAQVESIDFNRDIRPIFTEQCTRCHGGVKKAGDVSYIYREDVLGEGESGEAIVVPGDPSASEMIRRIASDDPDERMPPPEEAPDGLSKLEVAKLTRWVKEGATWNEHWAFDRPRRAPKPAVHMNDWPRSRVDHFILSQLESVGLSPSDKAPRMQWLRRVSFDLIGLPPTLEEMENFQFDTADDAYAKVVNRLLQSERFGERWAALWLDLVRYADSMGYERDPGRTIWPYRDWVIRALNEDMPFDEFTVKQLAGDLIQKGTMNDLIATAMHRNSQTNAEGGSDDEEFRIAAVIDRVNTTWTVWQGLTFGCVQCHNHPYEPFRQQEYYQFAAFFNNAQDCDMTSDYPTLRVPRDESKQAEVLELLRRRDTLSASIMRPFQHLAEQVVWRDVAYRRVESNKPRADLGVREVHGKKELFAAGTVGQKSVYTVGVRPAGDSASDKVTLVGAIRLDVPMLEGTDSANPSPAFVVTGMKLTKETPNGPEEVSVTFVASDDGRGMYWAPEKWGAFPNQFHDRWAVLIPQQSLSLEPDELLVLEVQQNQGRDGAAPPVLRRFRVSLSSDDRWQAMAGSAEHAELAGQREAATKQLEEIESVRLPIMLERLAMPRTTAVFRRGNWLDKTDVVGPGVPAIMPPLEGRASINRLDMAEWLVSEENPLTSRVAVNRIWAALFGVGIVETQEDFASTGTPPSHPNLLDDLAVRFREEHAWSIKSLLRELTLSATYCQDAQATGAGRQQDPKNRLLWRGPRNRLTAEMIRDQALAVAGKLSTKMFGPPVKPPQPDGVWQTVYSSNQWETATGEDRFRRGIYTHWRRSTPYPTLTMFDAPGRQVCSPRRVSTNTPLQALATMNDPAYFEAAQAFAERLERHGAGARARIAFGLKLATTDAARSDDVEALLQLYEEAYRTYRDLPELAKKVADTPARAALTLVSNTILNLDAALNR